MLSASAALALSSARFGRKRAHAQAGEQLLRRRPSRTDCRFLRTKRHARRPIASERTVDIAGRASAKRAGAVEEARS